MMTRFVVFFLVGLNAFPLLAAPEVTWSVMHPTDLDPAYMARVAAKAVEYGGVDSFEVCGTCHSGMGGMDGLLLMEPYPTTRAKRDAAAVRKIRADLKGCIAAAHKVGKKLYYWHREGYLPAGILEDLPGLKDADGEIDLLGETFASYLRWKVHAAFEAVPELDGFVLTLTEADFSVIHNSNADRYPPAKVVEKIVRIFCEEHAKRGKRFILRSFGSVAKDYEDIIAGGVAAAKDFNFEIETKATPYDFSPFLPDNPFLKREPGTTLGVECDGIGEFLGAGYPPCAQVDTIHRYVTNARKAGADRYAIRIDRIANSIFDSAQEINLYAYMRFIADSTATPQKIKNEWAARRWKGCEQEMIRLSDISYEMTTKMEFLNGNVIFHQHPVAPRFKFLKAGGMFSVFRDNSNLHMAKRLWGIKSWEKTPGRAALLAEKDRSVALADEGVRILESVRGRLDPAEYARQKRAWEIATKATRATRAFIRCGAAYFDDMDAGEARPKKLAAAVSVAEREISSMMSNPKAGVEGLNVRHSAAVGQDLDRVYFIPLRWLCREFLNEYAAEAKVRAELKARKDVLDFVVPGGIYDDNRVDRPMHGSYPELVDGQPIRWIGNAIFPNGTIRVEFKDVPDARVEVILSPKGSSDYALSEKTANGVRTVTIGKKGARHPAVVAVAYSRLRGRLDAVAGLVTRASADRTKLMSYNIRHGKGMDGQVDLARIAAVIRAEKPDFVGLQEVDVNVGRSGGVDQVQELARLTGLNASFARAIRMDKTGEYGVAILSRQKPIHTMRFALPGTEPRMLEICDFPKCYFATMHLSVASNAERMAALETVRRQVASLAKGKKVFLCGDWNSTPDSPLLAEIGSFARILSPTNVPTYHGKSRRCLDYIAVDRAHADYIMPTAMYVVDEREASDHAPVVVEF